MAGLNKHIQKKFQEVSSIDTIGEVIKPCWFTDTSTGTALPPIDSINKMKKIVLVDGYPCKNARWLEGVYKALKLVAGISTLKAEKKKVFPKLNFSHTVIKDDQGCKEDVLSIRGIVSLPCEKLFLEKNDQKLFEEAVEHGKFFNICGNTRFHYSRTLILSVTFKTYSYIGEDDSLKLKIRSFKDDNRVLAYKKLDDQTPIAIEDLLDNFLKLV